MSLTDVTRSNAPSLTSDDLLGYMLAEFAKSGKLRVVMFHVQLLAVLPGVISILVRDGQVLYYLAAAGVFLLICWWLVYNIYSRSRGAAQTARRAVLLTFGLGADLTANTILSLKERFTVTPDVAKGYFRSDYYATSQPSGSRRLGEMLEESAFYSARLQQNSANVMLSIVFAFIIIVLLVAIGGAPYSNNDRAILTAKIFLAFSTFVVSSDVLGSWLAHRSAAEDIRQVRDRLREADSRGYPEGDVVLALLDYSAAIESAPEVVPFVYRLRRDRLNSDWSAYQADRQRQRNAVTE